MRISFPHTALAWVFAIVWAACHWPMAATAQQGDEAEEQKYISIRIDVYSKNFKAITEDSSGLKLKVAISTAVYRYETLDELFDRDIEHVEALGLRPKLEFEYPTPLKNISFVPETELAINRSLDTSNRAVAAAVEAAGLYRKNGDDKDLKVRAGIKYATRYEQDGLNSDDYVEASLRVSLREIQGFRTGERYLTITPFGEIKRYVDDLEFETRTGAFFDVDRQYELGFEFNTDPRKKIWGVALPKLRISYAFGDDFKGIKIRL